jgi:pimeloyl-ACP methyl ester carboxylesterase
MIDRREALKVSALGVVAASLPAVASEARSSNETADLDHLVVRHRRVSVHGVEIFYREAGRPDSPALLLLHGFPSSSHMFRHLIPALADRYRVVAPDYPAFGYSEFPPPNRFEYSFANYAKLMAAFADAVGLSRYAIYIQDYGAPVGLRLALLRPDSITALITQNGNAYEEGLSPLWEPLKAYWRDPSAQRRKILEGWLGPDGVQLQYKAGVPKDQLDRLAPDTWSLDWSQLNRPGNQDVQIALFGDYRHNVALYPEFQAWMRGAKRPTLVLWGKNDPFFTIAGAYAFKRDNPAARIALLDGSHFLLETHGPQATGLVRSFLGSAIKGGAR